MGSAVQESRSGSRSKLTSELRRELNEGHPLHGGTFTVVGRSETRDDVLVKSGDHWVLIHLTWSGLPELPPLPESHFFNLAREVERAIAHRG